MIKDVWFILFGLVDLPNTQNLEIAKSKIRLLNLENNDIFRIILWLFASEYQIMFIYEPKTFHNNW
jgi:hypothetical protein